MKCITYNRCNHLTLAKCNSSDPSQKWIWTKHNQILHVNTLKCIQRGAAYRDSSTITLYMDLSLKNCVLLETEQQWQCNAHFLQNLQRTVFDSSGQELIMYITYTNDIINAQKNSPTGWKRGGTNMEKICSSRTFSSLQDHSINMFKKLINNS